MSRWVDKNLEKLISVRLAPEMPSSKRCQQTVCLELAESGFPISPRRRKTKSDWDGQKKLLLAEKFYTQQISKEVQQMEVLLLI